MNVNNNSHDVLVVGAGISGLSAAVGAVRAGRRVLIVRGTVSSASSAAAGMLSPAAEATWSDIASREILQEAYSGWFEKSWASNFGTTFRRVGSLFVGLHASDRLEHGRQREVRKCFGATTSPLTSAESPVLFRGVSPRLGLADFASEDGYVDSDEVLRQIESFLVGEGVAFFDADVLAYEENGESVRAITTSGEIEARVGFAATGYSTLQPGNFDAGTIRPLRGITIRLDTNNHDSLPMIRGIVEGRSLYVVRRDDGVAIIGSSSEESAARHIEARWVQQLLSDSFRLLPDLENATLSDIRVGIRPTTSDHLPVFRRVSGGWSVVNGSYRHGFLLAPWVASMTDKSLR